MIWSMIICSGSSRALTDDVVAKVSFVVAPVYFSSSEQTYSMHIPLMTSFRRVHNTIS